MTASFAQDTAVTGTDRYAQQGFYIFALLHLVVWTLVPFLVSPNAPLDVIEGYAWGREWVMGTHKHPPMQAWWLEVFAQLSGRSGIAHFLASQIAIVAAFWAVRDVALRMTGPATALAAVLLLEGIAYYNFFSTEFNPNILQILFWALAGHAYYRAVTTGRTSFWVLLGLWAACGLYSKYYAVFFLAVLAGLTLYDKTARRCLLTRGPYVALAVCVLLFAPHFLWLVEHDFMPLAYTKSRVAADSGFFLWSSLSFTAAQLGILLPMLVLAWLLCGSKRRGERVQGFDRAFLNAVTFGPWALTCAVSMLAGYGLRDMWGAPFWNFVPLWVLLVWFGVRQDIVFPRRFVAAWCALFVALAVVFALSTYYYPAQKLRGKRVHFPGKELARIVEKGWQENYGTQLAYVAGDAWVAGNAGYYVSARPALVRDHDPAISPWLDWQDFYNKGGVVLALPCVQPCTRDVLLQRKKDFVQQITNDYPDAQILPDLSLPLATGYSEKAQQKIPPVIVFRAHLPPQKTAESKVTP